MIASSAAEHLAVVSDRNQAEARLIEQSCVFAASHLMDVCKYLSGQAQLALVEHQALPADTTTTDDFNEVKGQFQAKRALEIAAAGQHNVMLSGPPGAGKSMLASRITSILPSLTNNEALECAVIRSLLKQQPDLQCWNKPPLRAPHHSSSAVALVGGGSQPTPGEISQAHNGVLFLDEITEFSRHTLEQLREPLENGEINIARANLTVTFPARFMLIAAHNPCPCGYHGDGSGRCTCTTSSLSRYQQKLSGPLLDRIDMHINVRAVSLAQLQGTIGQSNEADCSKTIRSRVLDARSRQWRRQDCLNSQLLPDQLESLIKLDKATAGYLLQAAEKLRLTARSYYRIKRLALTIADLEGVDEVAQRHIAEALSFRR